MSSFYRRSVTGRLQTGEFLMNDPQFRFARSEERVGNRLNTGHLRLRLMCRLQMGDFAGKQRVGGKLVLQAREQLQRPRLVLLSDVGNR